LGFLRPPSFGRVSPLRRLGLIWLEGWIDRLRRIGPRGRHGPW